MVSTLTIGTPSFFLALAPNLARARPGFVRRVLRFAVPAGLINGAAAFASYCLARLPPDARLPAGQTSAVITLFTAGLAVLVLAARPFAWWKAVPVGTMAGLFVLVSLILAGRSVFELEYGGWEQVATSLAVAAGAVAAKELLWRLARRRDGETDPQLTPTG